MGTEHPYARGGFIKDSKPLSLEDFQHTYPKDKIYLYARGGLVTSDPEEIFEDGTNVPRYEGDMVHSPSHYVFPGGVEVKHLSQHLTSMGGQAVQYIARATRLDGNVKGNQIEDIDKAIEVLQIERERLSRV